jgi:hypothetical protein
MLQIGIDSPLQHPIEYRLRRAAAITGPSSALGGNAGAAECPVIRTAPHVVAASRRHDIT